MISWKFKRVYLKLYSKIEEKKLIYIYVYICLLMIMMKSIIYSIIYKSIIYIYIRNCAHWNTECL